MVRADWLRLISACLAIAGGAWHAGPAQAQGGSVKAVFEKYDLLGPFAIDCTRPASSKNLYHVHRAIDDNRIQAEQVSGLTAPDFTMVFDRIVAARPNQLVVSGTISSRRYTVVLRLDKGRKRTVEMTLEPNLRIISGGRRLNTGETLPWHHKCEQEARQEQRSPAQPAAPAAASRIDAAAAPTVPAAAPRVSAATPSLAAPGRRVALVVGNGEYRSATPLANPVNDATDMARALRQLGFDVVEGKNLDRRGMDDSIREFGRKLDGADLALFFYAGHGLQVNGKNYLVPIDAKLERPGDLVLDAVDIGNVLAQMEAEKRVNLVFLDACRDNPLARSLARSLGTRSSSVGQGLASIKSAIGTMIAYATQPDNVALDGSGRNSPFTGALLKHIATPGVDIGTVMRRVRSDVITATREQQVPWDHSSLTGDVILAR
jgi:Caspase domain